jgi:hypothetical protein
MTNENTLYPNIMKASAEALAAAGHAPCAVCGAEDTKPYMFAYGKKVGEERGTSTNGSTTTTVTTTYYDSLAAQAVHLCANCVDIHRRTMLRSLWVTIAGLALASLGFIVAAIAMPGTQAILTILATISPLLLLFFFIRVHLVLTQPDRAGPRP